MPGSQVPLKCSGTPSVHLIDVQFIAMKWQGDKEVQCSDSPGQVFGRVCAAANVKSRETDLELEIQGLNLVTNSGPCQCRNLIFCVPEILSISTMFSNLA